MIELIKVKENNGEQVVSGRELHKFLEVKTEYKKWFDRMAEYGFIENIDFVRVTQKCPTPGGMQNVTDHALKLDMAKEISMIQRTEKGKQARHYFIKVEKEFKSSSLAMTPEEQIAIIAQGNVNLNKKVEVIESKVEDLTDRFGLPAGQAKTLQKKIAQQAYTLLGGKWSNAYKKLSKKLFTEFHRELKNYFDVPKYSDIPLSRFDEALNYASSWQPSMNTMLEIRTLN